MCVWSALRFHNKLMRLTMTQIIIIFICFCYYFVVVAFIEALLKTANDRLITAINYLPSYEEKSPA